MNVMYGDKPRMVDRQQSRPACLRRLPSLALFLAAAVLGISHAALPARAAPLDEGVEHYRSFLIADVHRTLASAQTLRASAAAGDVAAAKQAWLDARIGWDPCH